MNGDVKRVLPGWGVLLGLCVWVWVGVSWVLRGAREFDLWSIVGGVGCFFLALYWLCLSRPEVRERDRKSWAYRVALGSGVVSGVLALLALVVPAMGVDQGALFTGGSPVAPQTLVRHPFIFNQQHVRTAGYVSANDRGWCVLEAGKAGTGSTGTKQSVASVIALATKGMTCSKAGTDRTWAKVSGTFEALTPSKYLEYPYVLTDVRIVRGEPRADGGG